jgi:uncharacterized protein YfaQ (DUF2300 family)
MQDCHIEQLTRELNELDLRRESIISELDLRREAIVSRIEQLQEQEVSSAGASDGTRTFLCVNGIQRGDRVRIKNKVKKPATWPGTKLWREDEYRSAIVTKVTPTQIFILTDNGVSTWRAPNNLRKAFQ